MRNRSLIIRELADFLNVEENVPSTFEGYSKNKQYEKLGFLVMCKIDRQKILIIYGSYLNQL